MRDAHQRAEVLGLTEAEIAFYDAVVQNDSAVMQMGDSVRAATRARIKRLLTKYDYPPTRKKAIELVLQQAELFAVDTA